MVSGICKFIHDVDFWLISKYRLMFVFLPIWRLILAHNYVYFLFGLNVLLSLNNHVVLFSLNNHVVLFTMNNHVVVFTMNNHVVVFSLKNHVVFNLNILFSLDNHVVFCLNILFSRNNACVIRSEYIIQPE